MHAKVCIKCICAFVKEKHPHTQRVISCHPTNRAYGLRAVLESPAERSPPHSKSPRSTRQPRLKSLGRDPSPKQGCFVSGHGLQEVTLAAPRHVGTNPLCSHSRTWARFSCTHISLTSLAGSRKDLQGP